MNLSAGLATAIAEEHGTPAYVYDAATIRARLDDLERGMTYAPRRSYYSVKANPAVAIARLMRSHGLGLDACSPGDLEIARRAGASRAEISFTGFGLTDAEMVAAAASSDTLVLDDIADLERAAALSDRPGIGVRVAPEISAGFHIHVHAGAADSKFGVPLAALDDFFDEARRLRLDIVGLHAHIGSDVLSDAPYRSLLTILAGIARERGHIHWINLGGGFGTPRSADEPRFDWSGLSSDAHRLLAPAGIELRLEPGAFLTMDAGEVLTRVTAVKPALGDRPTTVVVDANTNHLASALLYGSEHPVSATHTRPGPLTPVRIVGNLMQAGDILQREVTLGPIRPGDLLCIGCAGAYAACRSPVFNERPRPAELLVDGRDVRVARRAETVADLLARDVPSPSVSDDY